MEACYVVIPGNQKGKRIGIVKFNEIGYYPTNYDHHETVDQCEDHVRLINESLGVSPEIEEAMLSGSMFGWDVPAARPAVERYGWLGIELQPRLRRFA